MALSAPRLLAVVASFGLVAALPASLGAAGPSAREQARATAAASAYSAFEARLQAQTVTAETVYVWSVRQMEAEKKTKGTLVAAQDHLARMRKIAAQVKTGVAAGTMSAADEKGAAYYVAEAELWVADAGGTP